MYPASQAFHQAVADGAPQKALLIFDDAVFTNDDIDVSAGISFRDYFNMEEDFAIGQAPSNEISFSLLNENRLLNDYKFGDFLATLGVLINTSTYQQTDGVKIITQTYGIGAPTTNTWTGHDVYPYVRKNGNAVPAQPSFPVRSLLGYNGKVYAFGQVGNEYRHAVYTESSGQNITNLNPLNSYMLNKSASWYGRGFNYSSVTRLLDVFDSGTRETYEFVPLGYFTAERPKAPDTLWIDMTCNDFMLKFDDDMPSKSKLKITYPITFKNLLIALCDYVEVDYNLGSFINSGAKLTKEPRDFEHATMRDVVKWIAEAAAGNARFNRDGKLEIAWFKQTNLVLTENDYESFDPYWYETKQIQRLKNRGSDGSYDNTQGSGKETYLIQDNPLLKGVK